MDVEQEAWAIGYLRRLLDMDNRHILSVILYTPGSFGVRRENGTNLYQSTEVLNMADTIRRESDTEAGSVAISCKLLACLEDRLGLTATSMWHSKIRADTQSRRSLR